MNLKTKLLEEINIDFPIKIGDEISIDKPIIIQKTEFNDYVEVGYAFLKYYTILKNITWTKIKQSLMTYNGRKIDRFIMQVLSEEQNETIDIYFDITECFGK